MNKLKTVDFTKPFKKSRLDLWEQIEIRLQYKLFLPKDNGVKFPFT